MKKYIIMIIFFLLTAGCNSDNNQNAEKGIQDSFKARADVVFLFKDKKQLSNYFSPRALAQSKDYINWSPRGQWSNVKDIKYSMKIRIKELKIDGKFATAVVNETVIITWDFIDPSQVMGSDFVKEDAWSNKMHRVKLILTPEGRWIIDEDIIS